MEISGLIGLACVALCFGVFILKREINSLNDRVSALEHLIDDLLYNKDNENY